MNSARDRRHKHPTNGFGRWFARTLARIWASAALAWFQAQSGGERAAEASLAPHRALVPQEGDGRRVANSFHPDLCLSSNSLSLELASCNFWRSAASCFLMLCVLIATWGTSAFIMGGSIEARASPPQRTAPRTATLNPALAWALSSAGRLVPPLSLCIHRRIAGAAAGVHEQPVVPDLCTGGS